ncbi:MAG: hypothetical protein LBI47_00450, partial [Puniceicoccales bacterium]|nr:hypothetical protein [Puniceicoccales bacterium]
MDGISSQAATNAANTTIWHGISTNVKEAIAIIWYRRRIEAPEISVKLGAHGAATALVPFEGAINKVNVKPESLSITDWAIKYWASSPFERALNSSPFERALNTRAVVAGAGAAAVGVGEAAAGAGAAAVGIGGVAAGAGATSTALVPFEGAISEVSLQSGSLSIKALNTGAVVAGAGAAAVGAGEAAVGIGGVAAGAGATSTALVPFEGTISEVSLQS